MRVRASEATVSASATSTDRLATAGTLLQQKQKQTALLSSAEADAESCSSAAQTLHAAATAEHDAIQRSHAAACAAVHSAAAAAKMIDLLSFQILHGAEAHDFTTEISSATACAGRAVAASTMLRKSLSSFLAIDSFTKTAMSTAAAAVVAQKQCTVAETTAAAAPHTSAAVAAAEGAKTSVLCGRAALDVPARNCLRAVASVMHTIQCHSTPHHSTSQDQPMFACCHTGYHCGIGRLRHAVGGCSARPRRAVRGRW